MRLSDNTRFPHPVLSPFTGDFTDGSFEVAFRATEDPVTGALDLAYSIELTEPGIKDLLTDGRAAAGCFVRCNDTYYNELRPINWPKGRLDFRPRDLVNRVSLRPIVWLREPLAEWDPGTIHPEFGPPVSLERGSIIAIGEESIFSVGQAKLAPIESIFELDESSEVPDDRIQVDLDRDRVTILVAPKSYKTIGLLREQHRGHSIVMNAVYLPAVMEVLDGLRDGQSAFEGRRWYQPFTAKCDAKGIDLSAKTSIFEAAQALLDGPVTELAELVKEDE